MFNFYTQNDHRVDDDYNYNVYDLKSAVNKEYLNDKFLRKNKDGSYFELKQNTRRQFLFFPGLDEDNDDLASKNMLI